MSRLIDSERLYYSPLEIFRGSTRFVVKREDGEENDQSNHACRGQSLPAQQQQPTRRLSSAPVRPVAAKEKGFDPRSIHLALALVSTL